MIGINRRSQNPVFLFHGGASFIWVLVLSAMIATVAAHSGFAQTPPPDADVALMLRLREQVMAIPEERREAEGVKILLENVDAFQDETTKKRVYLSIAELLAKLGDKQQSLGFFEKAGTTAPDETDSSGIDVVSRSRLLDLLNETGKRSDVEEKALAFRDKPDVSDSEYAELTYRAGRALIQAGKVDEGIKLGMEAAKNRPCERAYEYLETLAADAAIHGNDSVRLETKRWIWKHSGAFGVSERFLSNLAHCEENSGDVAAAIRVLEQLTESHPTSSRLGDQILRLSALYDEVGDKEKSKSLTARVRDGDFPAEVRARATRALEFDAQGTLPPMNRQPISAPPVRRFPLLLLNGGLILVILTLVLARRGWFGARFARGLFSTGPQDQRPTD